jgi:hypothetical protein
MLERQRFRRRTGFHPRVKPEGMLRRDMRWTASAAKTTNRGSHVMLPGMKQRTRGWPSM